MIEKILTDYITFIRSFEALLKDKYKQDINPCSFSITFFKRVGSIEGIEYYFHGSGCTAKKDGISYEYDISVNEINFSQWKFSEFIRTHPEYQKLNYSAEFIELELFKFINKGILEWLTIEGLEGKAFGCVFMCYRVVQESFFIQ
ncbi:hypothetical protein DBB36_22705 [Flavobacterium sp. WLB]|uniref:DUF6896 domain-containing protein n=1 Tax=unclassified Flavobacterium TaxID=196869 RepID=UPI0006AB88BD|nr:MULTISPECIES: hypothetical protein [unclassified Flavobacterium]KOP39184.1 hypothetical protein AKO67_06445 [Flavobacterium sp. VMW]OWU89156.1 hypothetical protein APR43_18310 [Flavobacterium sp. NLM]PUU67685.1 hypothetical protein DBB36_22705 [Flavobacterium sp. WLB]